MRFLTTLLLLVTVQSKAQVYLHPMPDKLSATEAAQFIIKNKTVWIPKSVNVGDLVLNGNGYYIMMAGRTRVALKGNIVNKGNNFIGNGDVNGTIKNMSGTLLMNCINFNPAKTDTGVIVLNGTVTAQQCRSVSGQYAFYVSGNGDVHGTLNVLGGNYRSQSEAAIKQSGNGHLHAFGVGFQNSAGQDIIITGKSWQGIHYIEGCRSEGQKITDVFVKVPATKAKANVYLRANSYTASRPGIIDYNANGNVYLVGNCNYSNENKGYRLPSVLASSGNIYSIGNNLGNTLDSATLSITGRAKMISVGDMTRRDNTKEPHTIPLSKTAFNNVDFSKEDIEVPPVPMIEPVKFMPIKNITQLGLPTPEQYGASVNNSDNTEALNKAIAENDMLLLTGLYKVKDPVQIMSKIGFSLWGTGAETSGIVSTTGNGCINVESLGYSSLMNFSLVNTATSSAATVNLGWLDAKSSKKGSALQNNLLYNLKVVNGAEGISLGRNRMGSEHWLQDIGFEQTNTGSGTASSLNNYNALSDNYINCRFSGWKVGLDFRKGYGNSFGCKFYNTNTALNMVSQVGNGLLFSNIFADSLTNQLFQSANSSSRSAVVFSNVTLQKHSTNKIAGLYQQGGTVVVQNSNFSDRTFKLNGGIGAKSITTLGSDAKVSGGYQHRVK